MAGRQCASLVRPHYLVSLFCLWLAGPALAGPALANPALAGAPVPPQGEAPPVEVVIKAPPHTPQAVTCAGSDKSGVDYDCLTRQVKAASAGPPPEVPGTPTAQDLAPSRTGTFSHTATAQRLGSNFGKAATPYRPPPPVYAPGIRP